MKPAAHVESACDALKVVGGVFRTHLQREIPAKVLLRGARDVVLLSGPTGAGKEMVAAVCHGAARSALGRDGALVEVNCANLRGGLFESELFGYRRGAFTGADRDYPGLVGKADNGTLVLDEIQCLEPQDQARLLRFLGEREYRSVGDDRVRKSSALIVLSTNRDLRQMVARGEFRRDVLDRAAAKVSVPALYERRGDIAELAQTFALEAATDMELVGFCGLTRRARADVEVAVVRAHEVSVRRLRELIRDVVFLAAADFLPDVLESDFLMPVLERELNFSSDDRDEHDVDDLSRRFASLVGAAQLAEISNRHGVSESALLRMCGAISSVLDDMGDARSYRNVVERANRLSKVALWLVSGAETQADFRRFFGNQGAEMPTKSVAHQIYYDVFPRPGAAA